MIKKIILTCMLALSAHSDSCWSKAEVASFAQDEFDEIARFSIKDAVTCQPISNAKLTIASKTYTADKDGIVTLALPDDDIDQEIPITIKKAGYIQADENVMTLFGSYWNNLFLMSKDLPLNSARFALTWGNYPDDLDINLKSDTFHISYRKTRSIKNRVKLDRDSRKGYGPETITVDKLDKNNNYRVIVNRYSAGSIDKKTKVRVYLNNKLDRVVKIPETTTRCIQVATINNNKIEYKFENLKDEECK